MAYFYSEKMSYCECMMPREIAWDVMSELGESQKVQFVNNGLNYDNPFIKSFKRCDESLAKIKQIHSFIQEVRPDFKFKEPESTKEMLTQFKNIIDSRKVPGYLFVNEVEDEVDQIHKYILSQKKETDSIKREFQSIFLEAALLITVRSSDKFRLLMQSASKGASQLMQESSDSTGFQYKCYMIKTEQLSFLGKTLFRISRGNILLQTLEIPFEEVKRLFHTVHDELSSYTVVSLIFQKSNLGLLLGKVQKLMVSNGSIELEVGPEYWDNEIRKLESKAKESKSLQDLTDESIQRYLFKMHEETEGSSVSRLRFCEIYIRRQREIYRQLSCFTISSNFIHFEIFVPTRELPLNIRPNQSLPPLIVIPKQIDRKPPSKFESPQILKFPQEILDTYGVPSYGEYNPAVTYIVTFGFFIGVMFGDFGHMLLTIPLFLYLGANVWAWTILFWMGYCGLIYNQFFGLNLGLFSSCYEVKYDDTTVLKDSCVYPIGVDSIWKVSENQMQFTNSLKMKLSVIIGVLHMLLGLAIRFLNGFKRKDYIDIFLLTLPQTIFIVATFVYMDFLIVFKWFQSYEGEQSSQAPSIISTMIAIYAQFGAEGSTPEFYVNERNFEKSLVITCLLMIPIMLFGKPIAYCFKQSKLTKSQQSIAHDQNQKMFPEQINHMHEEALKEEIMQMQNEDIMEEEVAKDSSEMLSTFNRIQKEKMSDSEDESMKELIVHQFIETIEYVLGTVSNTASYLRLWALSLAHAQLSQVIFELILEGSLMNGYASIAPILIIFPLFLAVTFGVLICMDLMECFLHALRLHWVEFQNKFYKGNGYPFRPFGFQAILNRTSPDG